MKRLISEKQNSVIHEVTYMANIGGKTPSNSKGDQFQGRVVGGREGGG